MKLTAFSLRTRITVSLLLIVIIGLAPYEVFVYLQIEQRLTQDLNSQADRKILRLKDNLIIPLWELDEEWIAKMIDIEMMDDNAYAIQVNGDENLFVSRIRDDRWQSVAGDRQMVSRGDLIERQQDITHDDIKIGEVKLYLSKRSLKQELNNEARSTALRALTLMLLIVLFLGGALNQLVVRPLFKILEMVKAIASGRYDVQIEMPRNDELGLLAQNIATMQQNLHLRERERDRANSELHQANQRLASELQERSKAQASLRELNETLEQRILARTAALQQSNQQLQTMSVVLENAKNGAEAANRAKSIFLANMTHELRTPMNAVLGFSRLMQNDKNLTLEQREVLDIINRSGNHLLALINQVLDLSKIESGRMVLENAPFDLGGTIRDIIDMMHERAESKGLTLHIDQCSSFPRVVSADATKLRHILINLLSNAIKYTQKGAVVLRLNTRSKSPDEPLVLVCEVEDTGIGIAEEDLSRIFDAFVQVGSLADQHGTGLGLVITKQYVELMGGNISVDSEPGKGSIFRVHLPVTRVNDALVETFDEINVCHVIGLEPGQKNYRILVVEDQAESRLLLKRLLENVGFTVFEACNGREGVEMFKTYRPDFVWMDRRMPVMDGIAATQAILALPEGKDTKIAAVTASTYLEERQALLAAGVCAIIYKPYRNEEIFECMAMHLGIRYRYDDSESPALPHLDLDHAQVLQKLASCSPDWKAQLQGAAIELDVERCQDVIHGLDVADAELTAYLLALINRYDFESLLKLLTDAGLAGDEHASGYRPE